MTRDEYLRLQKALSNDTPDVSIIKEIIKEQAQRKDISPMLSDIASSMLAEDEKGILHHSYVVQSFANFIPCKYNYGAKYLLENDLV